ncbi:MAG: glycosyltransferase family 4 protein [Methylobacteriaceae bacterium]|nr:glycosyltransferase family 4 protein [Methylobacteriaceae bacterium]
MALETTAQSFSLPPVIPDGPSLAGKTVLQIIPELEAGGAERTTVDIAEALAQQGACALVASEGGRLVGELQARGGSWIPFPAATKNPFRMVYNIRKLVQICQRERVDLLHARSRAPAWVALAAARLLHIPFITTYHGSYSAGSSIKNLYNSVMARGDVVIANSRYTADLIRKAHPASGNRIAVIYRGTDLSEFSLEKVGSERIDAVRKAWGVSLGERVVLLAARLTGWKGQKVLIEAAAQLKNKPWLGNIVFVLAGDAQGRSGYVKELEKLIVNRGLRGTVRLVGHCADMPAAFLASAAVVVPSTEPEAFGRSAVEAQALGIPVVVSDLGAVPETVLAPPDVPREQRTGWRVPAGDAGALADVLVEVLSLQASAASALSQRARLHVEQHFSLRGMVEQTINVYERVLISPEMRRTS